ncbi:hypothetical protein LTR91_021610, partial [Friedmanniomyces endolithicus]
MGLSGSFSPAHCDLWNGTWIRTLDGVKMWNVAVDTTESEVEELAVQRKAELMVAEETGCDHAQEGRHPNHAPWCPCYPCT